MDEMNEKEMMKLILAMDEVDAAAKKAEEEKGAGGESESSSEKERGRKGGDVVGEPGAENVVAVNEGSSMGYVATKECEVKVKQIGEYLAKITLADGFVVPLMFKVERR